MKAAIALEITESNSVVSASVLVVMASTTRSVFGAMFSRVS